MQYCEYYPDYEKCKAWLEKNLPDEFSKVKIGDDAPAATDDAGGEDKKKSQRRGGKGILKAKKVKADVVRKICVSRAPRGKKKSVTVVTGLSSFGLYSFCVILHQNMILIGFSLCVSIEIDLKVAAKFFGTKFACGSSVTGDDEIVIQGDVKDDLFDIIPEKWPEIDEDSIDDLGDQKR